MPCFMDEASIVELSVHTWNELQGFNHSDRSDNDGQTRSFETPVNTSCQTGKIQGPMASVVKGQVLLVLRPSFCSSIFYHPTASHKLLE